MKLIHRIIPIFSVIMAILMLASCGLTIHEGIGDGDAMDKSSGTAWYHASTCYEAVALEDKLGKLVVSDKESLEIYKILDMDPDQWIATEDKNVLYTSAVTLPSLSDMKPSELYFYIDGSADHKLHTISDSDTLQSIIKAYSENESFKYPAQPAYKSYRVKFNSTVYKGLYYALTYVEYSEDYILNDVNYGKYFLYDRFDQKCIPVGDEIHTALGIE